MTYQLTHDEMAMVREMVRILVNAHDFGLLSPEQEEQLMQLAVKLDPIIQ